MTQEAEKKMKSTIHDFIVPIMITLIGALATIILWFLVKVYERVDTMYAAFIDQKIRVERIDTKQDELTKNYTEFKGKTQQDLHQINEEIYQIKLDVGITNIDRKNNNNK